MVAKVSSPQCIALRELPGRILNPMSHSTRVAAVILVLGTCCQVVAQTQPPAKRPAGTQVQKKPVAGTGLPAGGVAPTTRTAGKERPVGQPLRVDAVSPELEQLLADWEKSSGQIETMTGSFYKYTYNHRFQVEERAVGEFLYEMPDRGVYRTMPAKIKKGDIGRSKDEAGKECDPYTLKPAEEAERWICTGKQVKQVKEGLKTYTVTDVPESSQGANIIESPLPFLFGMKAEQAKRRYQMRILSHDKGSYLLEVIPKLAMDSVNYRKAFLFIDDKEFLPRAVRLIDAAGQEETVHNFTGLQVNQPAGALAKLYTLTADYRRTVENENAAGAARPAVPGGPGRAVPQSDKSVPSRTATPEARTRSAQGPAKTKTN